MNQKLSFSQRKGLMPIRKIQVDSFDTETQNRLWDIIGEHLNELKNEKKQNGFISDVYIKVLKIYKDDFPEFFQGGGHSTFHGSEVLYEYYKVNKSVRNKIKKFWFDNLFNKQLDIIEIFIQYFPGKMNMFNELFEELNVGYRIVGNIIVDNINKEEIKSLRESQEKSTHMQKAINFLYNRKDKDYENAIKESVSAVEEVSKKIVGDKNADLSKCIKKLKKENTVLHPAFLGMLDKLYRYASDEEGVRHAVKKKGGTVSFKEAKLVLLLCSAVVIYLNDMVE